MKNVNFFRSVSMMLTLLTLASCGSGSAGSANDTAASQDTTTEAQETTDYLSTIPAVDLGGTPFRIVVNDQADRPNLHAGEMTGEIINDAMVERDRKVEEMFNTKIEYTAFDDRNKLTPQVKTVISAGEDAYDVIITTPCQSTDSLALAGMLSDLASINTLNLDAEWWNESMNDAMTHKGKTYATAGPMALCYCYSPYAFFVNLNMVEDYKLPNVYDMVRDGSWTLDSMASMMKNISADLDNDGKMSGADRFGISTTGESGKAFFIGCGQKMAEKTDDGVELYMDSAAAVDVLEKLNSIMRTDDTVCTDGTRIFVGNTADAKIALFLEARSLFGALPLQWGVLNFRDMKDDYAILPYPKFNEAQTDYYTHMNSFFPYAISIPVTNTRLEETGAVMEALSYISQTTILPKINEVVLNEKIARDEDSKEMLDILFENVSIDLNTVFDFGGSANILRSFAVGETENYVSEYAGKKTAIEAAVQAMLDAYEDMQ